MTTNRRVAVRRNATANPPQIAVQPPAGVRRRDGRPEAQEPAETQLVFVFPAPKQRTPELPTAPRGTLPPPPPMPHHPTHLVRDQILALCGCGWCGRWFANERAWSAHRDHGRCLTPADAKLILLDRPYECWGFPADPKETT